MISSEKAFKFFVEYPLKGFKKMEVKLGVYQHYKGNYYQVVSFARHSETLEELIVYQELYGNYGMWVRPQDMFLENIFIEGKEIARFKFVNASFSKLHIIKS